MWSFVLVVALAVVPAGYGQENALKVRIDSPADGAEVVSDRQLVQGLVTDPGAEVWVVVHPTEVSDYWVQPRVTVRSAGSWKVSIYVGRPGNVDSGKLFEVRAVARPKIELQEGVVLDKWPEAEAISEVVELKRR